MLYNKRNFKQGTPSERQKIIFGLTFFKTKLVSFYSWHNDDFYINTFIHFIHVVKRMNKMSRKCMKKKIAWKSISFYSPVSFSKSFSIMGLRNAILQYSTLSMMCILVTRLEWRPQGGTQNKQRASVRLYWLSSPLTACQPPKYPVSASVQSMHTIVRRFLTLWTPSCLADIQFLKFLLK